MTRSHFIATTAAAILAGSFDRKIGEPGITITGSRIYASSLANELEESRAVHFDPEPTPLTDKDT